jgi:predicted permease
LRAWSIDLHPDLRVAAFAIGICALTALLAALAPAWNSARHDLSLALRATLSDRRHQRLQAAMCAMQVALCTLLLIFAGLMIRTLRQLRAIDAGFDRDHVAIFSLDPHVRGYDSKQNWAFQQRLLEAARAVPGVEAAGIATRPLMRGIGVGSFVALPGQTNDGLLNSSTNVVSPEYFDAMGMHLIAGRELTEADRAEQGKIANVVVNEAFARHFFGGQNPLGRQFATGRQFVKPMFEIVGVVNDTKYRSLREIPPPIFYSYDFGLQPYPDTFVLHVRTHGDPRAIIQPIRRLVQSIDPAMPMYQIATLSEEIDRSLWQERSLSALGACFGAFAAALAGVGIYGILAHFVAGRRREIGVRMALGARAANLVWLVARRVLPPVAGGIAAGAVASFAASTWVRSLLYGIEPSDARSSSAAVALLLITAVAAAAAPVWRVLRLDPAATLRQE